MVTDKHLKRWFAKTSTAKIPYSPACKVIDTFVRIRIRYPYSITFQVRVVYIRSHDALTLIADSSSDPFQPPSGAAEHLSP